MEDLEGVFEQLCWVGLQNDDLWHGGIRFAFELIGPPRQLNKKKRFESQYRRFLFTVVGSAIEGRGLAAFVEGIDRKKKRLTCALGSIPRPFFVLRQILGGVFGEHMAEFGYVLGMPLFSGGKAGFAVTQGHACGAEGDTLCAIEATDLLPRRHEGSFV